MSDLANPQVLPDAAPVLLLVDDEPAVLSALRRLFKLHGFKTQQAVGGVAGLALLQTTPVDLVLSDMRMPEMDGAQFLAAVRELDPSIPRLLLTGYADIESTIAAINRGAIHRYLSKPWNDAELILAVRDALDRRRLERQNQALQALTLQQNEQLKQVNASLESRVAARTAELQQVNDMLEATYSELDKTFLTAVSVFSGFLELREGHAGHARRVAEVVRGACQRLAMTTREVRDAYLAALLHDVGKIGFPDRMLGKAVSAYNAEEVQRYRRHCADGETALMPLPQLHGAARLVRQHHERFDGKGFPDGLSGSAISWGAQVIAAVSDHDGLLHGGLSEQRHGPESARQLLKGGAGTRYDPRVVEAVLSELDALTRAHPHDIQMEVRDLKPGMVLARDLLSQRGAILLAAGYVFDERIIRQVVEFANRDGIRLILHIQPATALDANLLQGLARA